ncbi:MAG: hypothetical protein ACFE91_13430 [Promethearchaeota archaeon]
MTIKSIPEEEIIKDIEQVKHLWEEVVNKWNDKFRSFNSFEFINDNERIKAAGDIFRNLDRYIDIIKNYYYRELYKQRK